jgi:arsenic resistance protein ArsH
MRLLGRWMRMFTIANQSSAAKALLTRDVAPYLVDRYSERRESAAEPCERVNRRSI